MEDLELIPRALEAESPEERATQLVRSNALFTSMVADLREDAPPAGTRDGALVGQWLADWDVYLDDRDAYRARLELGVDTAFEVSARDRRQITSSIDLFADVNGMPSCMTPGDV